MKQLISFLINPFLGPVKEGLFFTVDGISSVLCASATHGDSVDLVAAANTTSASNRTMPDVGVICHLPAYSGALNNRSPRERLLRPWGTH